jgi:hypothetical protein
MRFGSTVVISAFVLTSAFPALASPRTRRGPTSQHFSSKRGHPAPKPAAVRGIDTDRTTQIQTALISKGYLAGAPTGTWSPETQEALKKLQSDNGWQTKFVPDSRAIIKLGLGPGSPAPEGALSSGSSIASPAILPESDAAIPSQQ